MTDYARFNLVVQDEDGTIVDGASISVQNEDTLAFPQLYSTRTGTTSLGNPFTASDGADAGFYVTGGAYKIVATLGGFSRTWRYVGIGTAAEHDHSALTAPVGIGTTNPVAQLEISDSGDSSNWMWGAGGRGLQISGTLDQSSNFYIGAIGSDVQTLVEQFWYRARGTQASPSGLLDTNTIGQWQIGGRSSVAQFNLGGALSFAVLGDWTGSNLGMAMDLGLVAQGSTTFSTTRFKALSWEFPSGFVLAVPGTATNDSAAAGYVGEVVTATGAGTAMTTATPANVTSISLTAGDWDVWASVRTSVNAATNQTGIVGSISTTSATHSAGGGADLELWATFPTGFGIALPVGTRRISVNTTTTVFLVLTVAFTVNTCTGNGTLTARRVR